MSSKKKNKWVRLKRVINWLKKIEMPPQKGDGGIISDKVMDVIGSKHQKDSTFVIKDTAVVKPLK